MRRHSNTFMPSTNAPAENLAGQAAWMARNVSTPAASFDQKSQNATLIDKTIRDLARLLGRQAAREFMSAPSASEEHHDAE